MKKYAKPAAIIAGFLALEILLYLYIDRPLAVLMRDMGSFDPNFTDFFRTITDLGKSVWYLVPCGLAVLFCAFLSRGKDVPPAYRRLFGYVGLRALFLFLTIGVSGIVADIIKPIAGRARPILYLRDSFFGFAPFNAQGFLWNGFPSGHTTTAVALACSLSLLYPRARILWFTYAGLLTASRVIVNAHYLSDVCAGAFLGWATTYLLYQHGMFRINAIIFPIDKPSPTE